MSDSLKKPKTALQPCPFCGNEDLWLLNDDGYYIFCNSQDCGAEGPVRELPTEAAEAWNRRYNGKAL